MKRWLIVFLVFFLVFVPVVSISPAWAHFKNSTLSGEKPKKEKKGKKKSARRGKGSKNGNSDGTSVGTINKSDIEFNPKASN